MARMAADGRVHCLRRAVHEVRARAAMHMDVHQPRRENAATRIHDGRSPRHAGL